MQTPAHNQSESGPSPKIYCNSVPENKYPLITLPRVDPSPSPFRSLSRSHLAPNWIFATRAPLLDFWMLRHRSVRNCAGVCCFVPVCSLIRLRATFGSQLFLFHLFEAKITNCVFKTLCGNLHSKGDKLFKCTNYPNYTGKCWIVACPNALFWFDLCFTLLTAIILIG